MDDQPHYVVKRVDPRWFGADGIEDPQTRRQVLKVSLALSVTTVLFLR